MSSPSRSTRWQLALAQTTSTSDFEHNLRVARDRVEEAASDGVDLLAFPEVCLYVGGTKGKLERALDVEGETIGTFRESAARHSMAILLGSVHERIPGDDTHVHNTSVLIGPTGEVLATYRKLKMFDLELADLRIKESDTIRAGESMPPVVDTPLGRLGLTICFDLRFNELYKHIADDHADVVFVPSNFTVPTGQAHWHVLLRARAIESQAYVVAPAQWGQHSPRYASYGHSLVVDPWGEIVAEMPEGNGLLHAGIDLERIGEARARIPMDRPARPGDRDADRAA